jgi:hypothetical protein
MTPTTAIAERERPHDYRPAAGGWNASLNWRAFCYESFTLKALSERGEDAIVSGVMTEAFTDISRGAGAAVRALRGNHRPLQFSARNLLFLTPTSDLRNLPTAN